MRDVAKGAWRLTRIMRLPLSEIELIVAMSIGLGLGAGLLVSSCFNNRQRHLIGWMLAAFGGLSTFPLRADVMRRRSRSVRANESSQAAAVHS